MFCENKNIIGYFHVCQKGDWRKSFDLCMSSVKSSGLYDATKEIRCGIVNDNKCLELDDRFNDPKIKIVFVRKSHMYERPTLLHMKRSSETDPSNTSYWYIHTKGIRHFGTTREENVIDWINLLLYWNVIQWRMALNSLVSYDIYGCNGYKDPDHPCWPPGGVPFHYSGNFWWANSSYIKKLPNAIGRSYTDPEFWICLANPNACNIYMCPLAGGNNERERFPAENYILPENFDVEIYKNANADLTHFQYPELILHYLNHGEHENRIFS